jgi:hypothetical protein
MLRFSFAIITMFFLSLSLSAQKHTPLPHGMTFGKTVNPRQGMPATKVESFMDKMTRISTTITGKVLIVDKPQGGWFTMDAGNGKTIKVHFKDYNITIPKELKGRTVMIEGVAQKQFIADDMQHFAGDTVKGKKQHQVNVNPKQRLTFEATGLMVE